MNKKVLLLDLDGTLLDTGPDLAAALNNLLAAEGRPPLPYERLRPVISHGALRMVSVGFGPLDEAEHARLDQRFIELYRQALAVHTRLFEGFEEVLQRLKAADFRWAVVTNKRAFLTGPLLEALGLCAHCVVCGDTVAERKPHPLPLLHAAKQLNVAPADCIYVGDAATDVQAAHAAGMPCLAAMWGYWGEDDHPRTWGADGMVEHPRDLLRWLALVEEGKTSIPSAAAPAPSGVETLAPSGVEA